MLIKLFVTIAFVLFFIDLFLKRFMRKKIILPGIPIKNITIIKEPFLHISISSPEICQRLYSKDTLLPNNLGMGNLFDRWLGLCMGCINTRDPAWSALRKIFIPLFSAKNNNTDELITVWEDNLNKLYNRSKIDYQPINIEKIIDNLPLKFILILIFGKTFVSKYQPSFDILQKYANYLMFESFNNKKAKYWVYQYVFTETNRKLKSFKLLWEFILVEALVSVSVKEEGIFIALYDNYNEQKNKLGNKLYYEMFSQTLIEIIYANQDVTTPAMAWLLVHYAQYRSMLNNINHFIEESGRLAPIFPTTMPKITTSDFIIDGVVIKKDTTICIDLINIGKCDEWKMDDLDKFRPERFNDIKMQNFVSRFGFGGRKCPGNGLATMLFSKVLESLYKNWQFVPLRQDKIIETDKTKPFIMPIIDMWILPNEFKLDSKVIYYDCPPTAIELENGFIAISVNKKSPYLTDRQKVDLLVKYFAENTKEKDFVILIADTIAHYNIQAFDGRKPQKAKEEAKKLGDQFMEVFGKSIELYGKTKIKLCRWDELKLPDMTEFLLQYPQLRDRILPIARRFLDHRGQGLVNKSFEDKIELITKYIYNELIVLVTGIYYNNKWHQLLYYSGSLDHLSKFADDKGSLHNFVIDLINHDNFIKIREELCKIVKSPKCKVPGFIGIDITTLK
jgi:cytochrome P450